MYCMFALCWTIYQGPLNILRHIQVAFINLWRVHTFCLILLVKSGLELCLCNSTDMIQLWNCLMNKNDTRVGQINGWMDRAGLFLRKLGRGYKVTKRSLLESERLNLHKLFDSKHLYYVELFTKVDNYSFRIFYIFLE